MKIILLTALLFFNLPAHAQLELRSSFNSTGTGRNISLLIEKDLNSQNQVGIGFRYNIGKIVHPDDQNKTFTKRLYPSSLSQHFGIEAFYQRMMFRQWDCIKPLISYDIQMSYATTRNRMFVPPLPYIYDINGEPLYKECLEFFGPFTFIEQYLSFGFKAHIFGHFSIFQKTGAGIMFILGKDEKSFITYDKFNWEFAGLISAGLVYSFK